MWHTCEGCALGQRSQLHLLRTAHRRLHFPGCQVGDVAIVHTYGPKPEMSLCVIEFLQHNVKKKLGWEPKHVIHRKNEIVEHCGIQVCRGCVITQPCLAVCHCVLTTAFLPMLQVALYLDELLQIMAGAFKVQGHVPAGLAVGIQLHLLPASVCPRMGFSWLAGGRGGHVSLGAARAGPAVPWGLLGRRQGPVGARGGRRRLRAGKIPSSTVSLGGLIDVLEPFNVHL